MDYESTDPHPEYYLNNPVHWPKYHYTGRPKTKMLFAGKNKRLVPGAKYLPVVRYPNIFYEEEKKQHYCGTFYFFEPESTVLLDLGNSAVFASKLQAHTMLSAQIKKVYGTIDTNIINTNVIYDILVSADAWKGYLTSGAVTRDELLQEGLMPLYNSLILSEAMVPNIHLLGTTALYPTDRSQYIGKIKPNALDFIDQEICLMAKKLRLDTVILQHEIGAVRSITEILDVRDFSYGFLSRVAEPIHNSWFTYHDSRYTTIWFPNSGVLSVVHGTIDRVKTSVYTSHLNRLVLSQPITVLQEN